MEFIDEHPVVSHRVRFRNRVEITETQAQMVKDGMVVVWLVRTRCQPPQYHSTERDTDDRYRFNVQVVESAVPLAGTLRDQALVYLEHGPDQGYLDLKVHRFRQAPLIEDDEFSGAERQLNDLADYLYSIGEFREGEAPVDAVRRVLKRDAVDTTHEPVPVADDAVLPLEVGDPFLAPRGLDGDGVEVVGSIYRNGQRPASRDLIENAFGAP